MTVANVRRKILDAFGAKARRVGIRDVGMNDLARDLQMSTRTIYKAFANKAELVHALLEDWASRFEDRMAASVPETAEAAEVELTDLITYWFGLWDAYPEVFWSQLRQDYPEAYRVFQDRMDRDVDAGRARLSKLMRSDVDRSLSELMIASAVRAASDESWLRDNNLTYRDAVAALVKLWSRATLKQGSE